MDEAKLKRDLDKLVSLRNTFIKDILGGRDKEELSKEEKKKIDDLIYEYKEQKAEILFELTAPNELPQITDPVLRSELKSFLVDGDEFITGLKRKGFDREIIQTFENLLKPEFNDRRLTELSDDLLINWINQYDLVYRSIETATIVIKNIDFPEKLYSLINELRKCVVLGNYLAAGIMLRTVAEVAVDDILERNYKPLNDYDLSEKLDFLERKSRFSIPGSVLDNYRRDLNQFVHGNKTMDREKIDAYLEIVLNQIQELYEKSE